MPWSGRRGSARRAARFACPHPPPGGGRCSTSSRARRFSALPHQVPRAGVAAPLGLPRTHLPAEQALSRGGKAVAGFSGGPLSVAGSQRTLQSVRGGVWPPALRPPFGCPTPPSEAPLPAERVGTSRQSNPSQGRPPPAESRVSIASRRQAHPPGGKRPSRRSTPRGGEHTSWEVHLVPPGTGIPLRVTYSLGECVTAELCPSEGRHDPCIQSFHWVQRILHPSHRRYISWREHVLPTGGTPSSRGTLHTGEVGPTGGRNPRVRYEGGGWVGRGNRRGLRHPHQARFPFHSSRPRHPTQRHTMPPQNTQNTPPPSFPTHKTPHLYLHNPCSAHTKPPLQQ